MARLSRQGRRRPPLPSLALSVAALHTRTRGTRLSPAYRACLALARDLRVPAVTADRAWADLDLNVAVRIIR
jgi:ribonuclease VapC